MYRWLRLKVGTGKSTLIKYIIEALDLDPAHEVAYITFTGKAALVLSQHGCPGAMTAHKFLYDAKPKANGTFYLQPKSTFDILEDFPQLKVVIVDEVSMLPNTLWQLLLSHHFYVIASGDPMQLPPIYDNQDNHVLDNPHVFLDEIMRQAQESEIIRLTMDIRAGKDLSAFKGREVQVINPYEVVDGLYIWGDIILTATNATRQNINQVVRNKLGLSGDPGEGDKVICLRNSWDNISLQGNPLVNGTIGFLHNSSTQPIDCSLPKLKKKFDILKSELITEDNDKFIYPLIMDKQAIITGNKTLTPPEEFLMRKSKIYAEYVPIEFNYGWAITTHRAQGSQWNKVVVYEENFPFSAEEHRRWLYTAATRAVDKLVIVRKT